MPKSSNLVSYFKDCYQADTRTLVVNNLFSAKIENRFFLEGKDEIINGNLPYYPIPEEYALEVEKNLSIYKTEKAFYCAALTVTGKREEALRKDNKICAPLFLYPSKIVRIENEPFVEINFEKRIININFLNSIKNESVDDLYDLIQKGIPTQFEDDISTVSILKGILEKRLYDFNGEEILLYPDLISEQALKKRLQPKQLNALEGFHLVPSINFCVMRRSSATQGIISELNELAEKGDYSAPLQYVLGEKLSGKENENMPKGWVPTILSQSQSEIIDSVDQNTCTLVVGPPGTGKSYSIAALALDYMSKGKSVLVASKNDQAVDVVGNKISHDLGVQNVSFRAGKSNYKKELKGHLENLFSNNRKRPQGNNLSEIENRKEQLKLLLRLMDDHASDFISLVENELDWAKYVAEKERDPSFFSKIKFKYIEWRNSFQTPHWEINEKFMESNHLFVAQVHELIESVFNERVRFSLYENRAMYRSFLKSLSARNSSRQDSLFEEINLKHVLRTFPIWLVNMADIHDVFPLEKEMFDLAIIDEATQCDIASCLPILQRAKKIVVVGDPKQLRHASFLSRSMQYALQTKNGIKESEVSIPLDYRQTSMLDLVDDRIDSQDQVCFLDEHFRSKPDLISFSNKHFYNGNLRIMTDLPGKDQSAQRQIIHTKGSRDKNGVNIVEADKLIADIQKMILLQKEFNPHVVQSIGVLSPFRDQVQYLGEKINSELDLNDINRHQIICGTAYSFQGEERDVMFISLAVDDDSHHSAVIHMNKADVFNVSMTRARTMLYVYQSFSSKFDVGKYVNQYLADIRNGPTVLEEQNDDRDKFLSEVNLKLTEVGLETWIGHSIAGLLVDLIFMKNGKNYGINLIGYPGKYEQALEMNDIKILTRAKLPVFPLPYTYWSFDQEACFKEVMLFSDYQPALGKDA